MPKKNTEKARFSQLWPYLMEHRGILIVAAVLSIIGAASTLTQPLLVNALISRVQAGEQLAGGLIWAIIVLLVFSALITGVQYYLLARTGEGIVLSARGRLVHKILRLPIAELDQRRAGDLVSRVSSDTTLLRAVLTQGLVDAVGGVFIFAGAIIGMLLLDPVLFSLTLVVIVIAVAAVTVVARQVRQATHEAQRSVGALSAAVERAVTANRTIRAAGAATREADSILTDARGAYDRGLHIARLSAAVGPIVQVALQAALLVVLGVGGWRVASESITIAQLVSFVLFLFLLVLPLGTAAGAFTSVQSALGALARIQEVLTLPDETANDHRVDTAPVAAVAAASAAPAASVSTADAISFESVDFIYPGSETTVLDGLSFTVPSGTKTALVGPSGAGKSTALALLERFYDAKSGAVRVDGTDVQGWDRAHLRAQFGYVEQDSPVLAGSLGDNLRLGAPDATDDDCLQALHEVNLEHLVHRDALGLDAPVGDEGVLLSGGERQRLALARVLLAGPPILLLDELTSSLDGLNEDLLRRAIERASAGRTLLVIAHRLATVVDSDQIVVIDHGQAVAHGTHEELLVTSPLYHALAQRQLLV